MTLDELANAVVEMNRSGETDALLAKDYSPDCVAVEAYAMDPSMSAETKGMEAMKAKHAWWDSMMEMRDVTISDPMVHGEDRFAVIFGMTAVEKQSGKEHKMQEVGIFTVADGKIVREEFFYGR